MVEELTKDEVNTFFIQAFGEEKANIAQKAFEASFSLNSRRLKQQVIDEIKHEIVSKDLLQAEFKANQAQMRQEMAEIKAELKQDIADLRAEFKQDITDLRAEFKQEIAEVKQEVSGVKAELKHEIAEVKINIIKWVVGIQVATAGVLIAVIKF
ncbi:coiled-coil domain-containing protein [Helicobacter sp. T3_23-1059]